MYISNKRLFFQELIGSANSAQEQTVIGKKKFEISQPWDFSVFQKQLQQILLAIKFSSIHILPEKSKLFKFR